MILEQGFSAWYLRVNEKLMGMKIIAQGCENNDYGGVPIWKIIAWGTHKDLWVRKGMQMKKVENPGCSMH